MADTKESPYLEQPSSKSSMFGASLAPGKPNGQTIDMTNQAAQPSSYYHSVTQKSRLILPTALWILLVVGGLCFLSLLSSLNKSIQTLDTLVELEQANHADKLTAAESSIEDPTIKRLVQSFADEQPSSKSWFSLPSWTSLEPQPHKHEDPIQTLMSKMMDMQDEMQMIPVANGASIIISELDGSEPGDRRIRHEANPESMIGDLLRPFGLGPLGPGEQVKEDNGKQQQSSGIVANIDKINININAREGSPKQQKTEKPKRRRPKGHQRRPKLGEQDEINSLDKSLDDLFSQLADGLGGSQSDGVLFALPPAGDSMSPSEPNWIHHNSHHNGPQPSFSQLVFPIESMLGASQPPQPHSPIDNSIPPFFGRPSDSNRLVFSLDPSPSSEHKHHKSSLGTPYELDVPVESDFLVTSNRRDQPIDDLVNSLAQGILLAQGPQSKPSELKFFEPQNGSEAVVLIDGDSGISGHKQSLAAEEQPAMSKDNQFGNLFNLFFGHPPKAPLVVAPHSAGKSESSETTTVPPMADFESKLVRVEPTDEKSTEGAKLVSSSESSTHSAPTNQETVMDQLVNSLFTLPQFSDASHPIQVEAQSAGNKEAPNTTESVVVVETTAPMSAGVGLEELKETTTHRPQEFHHLTQTSGTQKTIIPEPDFHVTTPSVLSTLHLTLPTTSSEVSSTSATTERPITTTPATETTSSTTSGSTTLSAPTVAGIVTTSPELTTTSPLVPSANVVQGTNETLHLVKPPKSFWQRADEFIKKNIESLKGLIQQ